jgi:hypothetical protein
MYEGSSLSQNPPSISSSNLFQKRHRMSRPSPTIAAQFSIHSSSWQRGCTSTPARVFPATTFAKPADASKLIEEVEQLPAIFQISFPFVSRPGPGNNDCESLTPVIARVDFSGFVPVVRS